MYPYDRKDDRKDARASVLRQIKENNYRIDVISQSMALIRGTIFFEISGRKKPPIYISSDKSFTEKITLLIRKEYQLEIERHVITNNNELLCYLMEEVI